MKEKLLTDESIAAYGKRLQKMNELKFSKEGDDLFIAKCVAESEQVDNLHVRASINDFKVDSDEPKRLAGSNTAPTPMELLLASFANCLEIAALLYFSFSNLKVKSIKVRVEALVDRRSTLNVKNAPFPGFYNLKYTWFIDSKESLEKIETILKKVDKNCPVKGTFARNHEFSQKIVIL